MNDSTHKLIKGGTKTMTSGFPHQNPMQNFTPPKVDALPQHGQQPDKSVTPARAPRKVKVRPGH